MAVNETNETIFIDSRYEEWNNIGSDIIKKWSQSTSDRLQAAKGYRTKYRDIIDRKILKKVSDIAHMIYKLFNNTVSFVPSIFMHWRWSLTYFPTVHTYRRFENSPSVRQFLSLSRALAHFTKLVRIFCYSRGNHAHEIRTRQRQRNGETSPLKSIARPGINYKYEFPRSKPASRIRQSLRHYRGAGFSPSINYCRYPERTRIGIGAERSITGGGIAAAVVPL